MLSKLTYAGISKFIHEHSSLIGAMYWEQMSNYLEMLQQVADFVMSTGIDSLDDPELVRLLLVFLQKYLQSSGRYKKYLSGYSTPKIAVSLKYAQRAAEIESRYQLEPYALSYIYENSLIFNRDLSKQFLEIYDKYVFDQIQKP